MDDKTTKELLELRHQLEKEATAEPGRGIVLGKIMARDQVDHEIQRRHREKGVDWSPGMELHEDVQ